MKSIKDIWICPYTLIEKLSRKQKKGLLLKVLFLKGEIGYSCVHPLPEFGEGILLDYVSFLREILSNKNFSRNTLFHSENKIKKQQISILNISLHGAWMDAQARSQSRSLFFGYPPIESHYLVMNISSLNCLEDISFKIIKIKINSFVEAEKFKKIIGDNLKKFFWRLDFNYNLSLDQWRRWEKENINLVSRIDFIEDPFFNFLNVSSPFSFALDWGENQHCSIRIIKPTRHHLDFACQQLAREQFQRVIFTHSLTHPLEARLSWVLASQFYKIHPGKREVCGFYYPFDFFEKNDFFYLDKRSDFYSPSGTGLGFDELLEKQQWKKII